MKSTMEVAMLTAALWAAVPAWAAVPGSDPSRAELIAVRIIDPKWAEPIDQVGVTVIDPTW